MFINLRILTKLLRRDTFGALRLAAQKFFCHRFAKEYGYAIIDIEVSYVQIRI